MDNNFGNSLIKSLSADAVGWGNSDASTLTCPECGFECNHFGQAKTILGNDNYDAGWGGRGDLIVIPIDGECGAIWEICFGFHKGNIAAFTRIIQSCKSE